MNVVLISDTHAHAYADSPLTPEGANARLLDVIAAMQWALDTARAKKAALVHCGDLFHDRKAIKPEVLERVGAWLENVRAAGVPFYVLTGNHDLSIGGDGTASTGILHGYGTVIREAVRIDIGGVSWGFMPYLKDPDECRAYAKAHADAGAQVLVGHLGLGDPRYADAVATDYETPGRIAVADLLNRRFKRVFLGHYHKPQDLDRNVHYVGSPLQLSFKEAGQRKRIIYYDQDRDTVTDVVNDFSPRFHVVATAAEAAKAQKTDFVWVKAKTRADEEEAKALSGNVRIDRAPAEVKAVRIDANLPDVELIDAYLALDKSIDPEQRAAYRAAGVDLLTESTP